MNRLLYTVYFSTWSKLCFVLCHELNVTIMVHFYPPLKNPHPHISVAWGLGDIKSTLKHTAYELNILKGNVGSTKKWMLPYIFSEIECKIGQQTYSIYECSIALLRCHQWMFAINIWNPCERSSLHQWISSIFLVLWLLFPYGCSLN